MYVNINIYIYVCVCIYIICIYICITDPIHGLQGAEQARLAAASKLQALFAMQGGPRAQAYGRRLAAARAADEWKRRKARAMR